MKSILFYINYLKVFKPKIIIYIITKIINVTIALFLSI